MKLKQWLQKWLGVDAARVEQTASTEPMPLTVSSAEVGKVAEVEPVHYTVKMPVLPDGVIPEAAATDSAHIAMDSAATAMCSYAAGFFDGQGFAGYPKLAQLVQISEYRSPSETLASEMTRKWIKIKSSGENDVTDKIKIIEAQLKRHKIRDLFYKAAELDGFYGRAQIFIDLKGGDQSLPLVISGATIGKGSLSGFKIIEPIWTSPSAYNSTDPTAPDFFKPTAWYVMGRKVHATRLMTFVSREVPDMLKPAYNFGGLSMTQLMEPYVNAWFRTRSSVNDLLDSFSTSGVRTNMQTVLNGGSADDIIKRAELFNKFRDNRGLLLLDKDTEEFFQFNVSLAGLDALQAQSQEHMAAPSHMPLIKLTGITPQGLNASSEGELLVWYDYSHAKQESLFGEPLTKILHIIQLDQFGEIDPTIEFEFIPLKQLDDEALSRVRKADADVGVELITAGVISPEEERARLAADKSSAYNSIDVDKVPQLPEVTPNPNELDDDQIDQPNGQADQVIAGTEQPRN